MQVYLDDANLSTTDENMSEVKAFMMLGQVTTKFDGVIHGFEEAFHEATGFPHPVAVSSGSMGLLLAMRAAAGTMRARKFILPVLDWISSANAAAMLGAAVSFGDADPDTWLIDMGAVPNHADHTVVVSDLFGARHDIDLRGRKTVVIEDASHTLGSRYNNDRCGDIIVHSLNGNKTITAGSGGVVSSRSHWEEIERLARHGGMVGGGFNGRMTALNALIASQQMKFLTGFSRIKQRHNQIYRDRLSGHLRFQVVNPGGDYTPWMTAALFESEGVKNIVMDHLNQCGVPYRPMLKPLHLFPKFAHMGSYPVAEEIYARGIILPGSTKNTDEAIEFVCERIQEGLK